MLNLFFCFQRLGVEGERYEKVDTFHLNPKSITMGQLYGEFDDNTHEWQVIRLAAYCRTPTRTQRSCFWFFII